MELENTSLRQPEDLLYLIRFNSRSRPPCDALSIPLKAVGLGLFLEIQDVRRMLGPMAGGWALQSAAPDLQTGGAGLFHSPFRAP